MYIVAQTELQFFKKFLELNEIIITQVLKLNNKENDTFLKIKTNKIGILPKLNYAVQ